MATKKEKNKVKFPTDVNEIAYLERLEDAILAVTKAAQELEDLAFGKYFLSIAFCSIIEQEDVGIVDIRPETHNAKKEEVLEELRYALRRAKNPDTADLSDTEEKLDQVLRESRELAVEELFEVVRRLLEPVLEAVRQEQVRVIKARMQRL